MPAIGTRDIDYKKSEGEKERNVTREYIDFPQSLPTIFLWNVFWKPMKRDGRSSRTITSRSVLQIFIAVSEESEDTYVAGVIHARGLSLSLSRVRL